MKKLTKQDVNVEAINGGLVVSAIVSGYRMKKMYFNHTRSKAISSFLKDNNTFSVAVTYKEYTT